MFHQVIYFLTRVLPVKGYSCNVRNVQIDGIVIFFFILPVYGFVHPYSTDYKVCTSTFPSKGQTTHAKYFIKQCPFQDIGSLFQRWRLQFRVCFDYSALTVNQVNIFSPCRSQNIKCFYFIKTFITTVPWFVIFVKGLVVVDVNVTMMLAEKNMQASLDGYVLILHCAKK